jgi:hypothetical protein
MRVGTRCSSFVNGQKSQKSQYISHPLGYIAARANCDSTTTYFPSSTIPLDTFKQIKGMKITKYLITILSLLIASSFVLNLAF